MSTPGETPTYGDVGAALEHVAAAAQLLGLNILYDTVEDRADPRFGPFFALTDAHNALADLSDAIPEEDRDDTPNPQRAHDIVDMAFGELGYPGGADPDLTDKSSPLHDALTALQEARMELFYLLPDDPEPEGEDEDDE